MYRNEQDKSGNAAIKGENGVKNFLKCLKTNGWKHENASEYEDIVKHIDIHVSKEGDKRSIDVKAHKSFRKDGPLAIGWVLLEHTNVVGGKGWLRGECSHVAFEQLTPLSRGFIVAKREELLGLWNSKVDTTKLSERSADAKYTIYTRSRFGRYDIISWVSVQDVMALPSTEYWEIEKVEKYEQQQTK